MKTEEMWVTHEIWYEIEFKGQDVKPGTDSDWFATSVHADTLERIRQLMGDQPKLGFDLRIVRKTLVTEVVE